MITRDSNGNGVLTRRASVAAGVLVLVAGIVTGTISALSFVDAHATQIANTIAGEKINEKIVPLEVQQQVMAEQVRQVKASVDEVKTDLRELKADVRAALVRDGKR